MSKEKRWLNFIECANCNYDIATGEGERSCNYGDCAYLPEELKVVCDSCQFNWYTMEGDKRCEGGTVCEEGKAALANVENVKVWKAAHADKQ